MGDTPRLPRVVRWTSSEEIYGYAVNHGAIRRIARDLDATNTILSLSKACWVLEKWGDTNQRAQRFLAQHFLSARRFQQATRFLSQPERVLFFRPQFYALMKHMARYGWIGDHGRPVRNEELEDLGIALFALTDIMSAEHRRRRRSFDQLDHLSAVALELVTTSHMLKHPDRSLALARARHLYINVHRRLASEPPTDFVDIETVFREATGVGLDEYMSIGLGILMHYYELGGTEGQLPPEQDFTVFRPYDAFRETAVAREQLRSVLDLISMTLADFRSHVSNHSNREMTFDFLVLKARPFLKLDDDSYALMSFAYLFERLTTGVYWIIFDHLKEEGGDLHLRFSRYNGVIFQEHVTELVKHITGRQNNGKELLVVDQPYQVGRNRMMTPDVMLFGDGYVVLIEASATRIQAKRTTSLGVARAFEEDCDKMILHNARSLDTFIRNMREGRVHLDGIDTGSIQTYYPVIVTIEEFPKIPIIDDYVDGRIREQGFLSGDDVAPLSILDVHDLETLEKWTSVSLFKALHSWLASPGFPHESFGNYARSAFGNGNRPFSGSWMGQVVNETFSEATTLMFGRPIPQRLGLGL